MKKLLIGLLTLGSISSFAGADCVTSNGVTIKTSPLTNGNYGQLVETSTGISVESLVTNGNEVVSFVSKDKKTISLSFFRRTGLGTAEIEDEVVAIKCKR